jgi:predicted DNA binding CopG/RHH family protein
LLNDKKDITMAKEKKIITPKNTLISTVAQEEKLLNVMKSQAKTTRKKDVHRLTVDFPEVVFDRLKQEADVKGYTYRELIVTIMRKYFELE